MYQTMPDPHLAWRVCRMCDGLPQSIAANVLEYSEVPLCVQSPWVLLLMPRILRSYHVQYILLFRSCCECATTLQEQHLSTCPPLPHISLILHCTWKFPTQSNKTAPLHTFCIHVLWGLRVFTSTDMVQPSPQFNHVSGDISPSNFRSWQSNPTPLHTCKITQCFIMWLQFLLYQENRYVVWLHDHLLYLAWSCKC